LTKQEVSDKNKLDKLETYLAHVLNL
jgi:hypothetical protein